MYACVFVCLCMRACVCVSVRTYLRVCVSSVSVIAPAFARVCMCVLLGEGKGGGEGEGHLCTLACIYPNGHPAEDFLTRIPSKQHTSSPLPTQFDFDNLGMMLFLAILGFAIVGIVVFISYRCAFYHDTAQAAQLHAPSVFPKFDKRQGGATQSAIMFLCTPLVPSFLFPISLFFLWLYR